ncbi:PEP-CTERM sorting domain-containing protein [Psychrobium sp. 1_MG-2023]|uniref:PEP-CTERM sorting domain-containing protein n=1 Tax=Psychrobium sp. 1_MG-2023 TaxID=3062624 RepID=UPI00269172EC|nr:PEP-CTERM sorting domain-containing protein [Psychrobium sp. 1_MG-2023]MDP2561173.1 PEP-CTERM sorting domain-containing protein [Psychrobium sp. 1_MG-2023]
MTKLIYIVMLAVAVFSFNSHASLITDEVFLSCEQDSGGTDPACEGNGLMSSIVGAGVEYPDYFNFQNSISIDVGDNSISVSFENGPYCGWFTCDGSGYLTFELTSLDWVGMPSGFISGLDVSTNMSGILTSFAAHSVKFELPETQVTNDMFLDIGLITQHGETLAVPEPSTLAIFALGMIGLISYRFKT